MSLIYGGVYNILGLKNIYVKRHSTTGIKTLNVIMWFGLTSGRAGHYDQNGKI